MKENQRVAVTKRMLQEGMLRLLNEKPLEKIHVTELCAESGINRATFYRHYETPHDVLAELENEITGSLMGDIPRHTPKNMWEAQRLLENFCTQIHNHSDLFKVLFRCNSDEDIRQKLTLFYKQMWELRKDEQENSSMDDDTAMLVITMLGGGCYYLLRQWIMFDIQKSPKEIAAILCNLIRWPLPDNFRN